MEIGKIPVCVGINQYGVCDMYDVNREVWVRGGRQWNGRRYPPTGNT